MSSKMNGAPLACGCSARCARHLARHATATSTPNRHHVAAGMNPVSSRGCCLAAQPDLVVLVVSPARSLAGMPRTLHCETAGRATPVSNSRAASQPLATPPDVLTARGDWVAVAYRSLPAHPLVSACAG